MIIKLFPHNINVDKMKVSISELTRSMKELFEKVKIPGTPTVYVNGYRLPRQYRVNGIEYFTTEIKSLTMESKGQEACSRCSQ